MDFINAPPSFAPLRDQNIAFMKQKNIALVVGVAYALVFVISIIGNGVYLESVLDIGNWQTSYQNIVEHPLVFRVGVSSWFLVIICDVLVAWGIYIMFSSSNKELAILAAWMRIIFASIYAIGFLELYELSTIIHDNNFINLYDQSQLVAQTMLSIKQYKNYVNLSFIFFGIHIGLLAYLILKSKIIHKLIGYALVTACIGYLINSFGSFLSSSFSNNQNIFIVLVALPAIVSELSLTIFLIVKNKEISRQLNNYNE